MDIVEYLQVMLFVFNLTLSTAAKKAVNCQNFKFFMDEDVVYNHILKGHVFRRSSDSPQRHPVSSEVQRWLFVRIHELFPSLHEE